MENYDRYNHLHHPLPFHLPYKYAVNPLLIKWYQANLLHKVMQVISTTNSYRCTYTHTLNGLQVLYCFTVSQPAQCFSEWFQNSLIVVWINSSIVPYPPQSLSIPQHRLLGWWSLTSVSIHVVKPNDFPQYSDIYCLLVHVHIWGDTGFVWSHVTLYVSVKISSFKESVYWDCAKPMNI